MTDLTLIQKQAIELHDKGFNVYPIPKKNVSCMSYSSIYFSSIHKSQVKEAFQGNCHIGVLTGPTSNGLVVLQIKSDEALNRYIEKAHYHKIPIWAIKEEIGGQIWFRTDVHILPNPSNPSQSSDIQVRTVNLNTGTPTYTIAPPTNSRNQRINWIATPHDPLQKLSHKDIRNLDVDKVIDFPTKPDPPKYETNIRQRGEAEGWSAAYISSLINQEREKYIERTRNRTYFWEYALIYIAHHWDWTGKEGVSDLAVICALIRHVSKIYPVRKTFRATQREISLLAHVSPNTVGQVFERLMACDPSIIQIKSEHPILGTRFYSFNEEILKEGRKLLRGAETIHFTKILTDSHYVMFDKYEDILEKGSVGYKGLYIHSILSSKPHLTKSEIADIAGMSTDTIARICRTLRHYGIIVQNEEYQYHAASIKTIDWQTIIEKCGVAGRSEQRRQDIIKDRQLNAGHKIINQRRKCEREYHDLSNWQRFDD